MPLDFTTIQQHFERFEGRIHHMYLCTGDRVTVGIGHMIPSAEEAAKLQFGAATKEVIEADWRRVAGMQAGRLAQFYRRAGAPIMHDVEIMRIFREDIDQFLASLRVILKDYDTLPGSVQLALLDMIYTLGPGGFSQYKRMLGHIRGRNWKGAAAECARGGIDIRGDRHRTIRDMLERPR